MQRVPLAFQCICGYIDERGEKGGGEEGREWRLPDLLNADDLDLCDELEEDPTVMLERFVEICRRRGLKINAGKSKIMVLGGEEKLECEVCVDEMRFEHVSEFKYLGSVLDELCTYEAECRRCRAGGGLQVVLGLWLC